MEIIIEKMRINDLDNINLDDFDDFWSYNILKEELLSDNSFYIIAKSANDILGFAGIKFLFDEAHITNIVTRKDSRNLRYRCKNARSFNIRSEKILCFNYIRSKRAKFSCNTPIRKIWF